MKKFENIKEGDEIAVSERNVCGEVLKLKKVDKVTKLHIIVDGNRKKVYGFRGYTNEKGKKSKIRLQVKKESSAKKRYKIIQHFGKSFRQRKGRTITFVNKVIK